MQKGNILQLSIVILGLVAALWCLQDFFETFGTIISWVIDGMSGGMYMYTSIVLFITLCTKIFICWLLVVKSASLAGYITKKTDTVFNVKIVTNNNDLMYLVIIAIGLLLAVQNISPLLYAIYYDFRIKTTNSGLYSPRQIPKEWSVLILNIILPTLLLMFGRPIANYFCKKIYKEDIVIEQDIDNITTAE